LETHFPNNTADSRLAWYLDARFGMFIHWGAYSAAGVEASWPIMAPELAEAMFGLKTRISEVEYQSLPARFNPVHFDPDAWVRIAKEAGMRYIVITAKHHDGFCMFDAPGTDYKITNTPYGKDICQQLAEACTRVGMRLGFYYSPPDMHHPGYRDTSKPVTRNWLGEPKRKEWAGYLDYMESHITRLLKDYGQVSILWFDGLVNHAKYDPPRFHNLVHSLSPDTLINDRLGDGYDFITPEQFIPKQGIPVRTGKPPAVNESGEGLFRTVQFLTKVPGIRELLKQQLMKYAEGDLELTQVLQETDPAPDRFQPWETCMTMGQSWAFNPHETRWKSSQRLLRNLVEVVSRGGNYLLNVGPTAEGEFPPQALERLQTIGRWMAACGDSVYGSTYTRLVGTPACRTTRSQGNIYVHLFEWPENHELLLEGYEGVAASAALITGEPLSFSQDGGSLKILLPPRALDPDVSVLVIQQ
jgi:alpha-L-fucosidase